MIPEMSISGIPEMPSCRTFRNCYKRASGIYQHCHDCDRAVLEYSSIVSLTTYNELLVLISPSRSGDHTKHCARPRRSRTNLDGVIRTAIIRTTVETALRIHHFWLICRASTMLGTSVKNSKYSYSAETRLFG